MSSALADSSAAVARPGVQRGVGVALMSPFTWPEARRGAERMFRDLAAGLLARGHRPWLITSHSGLPSTTTEDGLKVTRSWRPPEGRLQRRGYEAYVSHVPASYLALERGSADLAHASHAPDAVAAAHWSRRHGRPMVFSFMGIPDRQWLVGRRLRLDCMQRAVSGSGAVVALSRAAADTFMTVLGVDARVIHPGVDTRTFSPGGERSEAPTILCTASLAVPEKRVGLLVEALPHVLRSRPNARLVLQRPDDLGLARSLGAQRGIELMDSDPGLLVDANRRAWVAALPSRSDAFGLVLAEALACGTPVVGSDLGGSRRSSTAPTWAASSAARLPLTWRDLCWSRSSLPRIGRRPPTAGAVPSSSRSTAASSPTRPSTSSCWPVPESSARVSVIVPARDSAAFIPGLIAALAEQDVDDGFELIVVDNGSHDDTAALAEQAAAVDRVIRRPRGQGPGAARNAGAAAASGEALAFIDADCRPTPGWLRAGTGALADADLVQGAVAPEPADPVGPFDRTLAINESHGLFESANLFVRRELFERLGGFPAGLERASARGARAAPFGEDVLFGWRARRAGARTGYCRAALAHHAVISRGPVGFVSEYTRLRMFPHLATLVPELREAFFYRRFFHSSRSATFDLALGALATTLATRRALPLAACTPYLLLLARSARRWGARRGPLVALTEVAADGVGAGALLLGSLEAGCPVL